jgi:hypothetical protein
MLRITPHPQFVAHLAARRGPLDFAPALKPVSAEKTWAAVAERTQPKRNYWVGRLTNDPDAKRALEMIKSAKLPEPWDARVVAVAERIVNRGWGASNEPEATLCPLVAEAHGVAAMVAMKLDSVAMTIGNQDTRIAFDGPEPAPFDSSWPTARAIVCRADDASYAAAREVAEKWRAGRPVLSRIVADYLFPSEPEWANADLDELTRLMKGARALEHSALTLLASANDPARVSAYLDQLDEYLLWQASSCEIAVSLPPADALRVLCKILERSKRSTKTQLAVLGAAMCALEGEEMAAELAGLLLHSPIGPLAVDYFRRFPELARAVLPKVAQGTSKAADAARSLLAASASKEDVPLAQGEEIPRLLRETPWRKRKKTKPVTLEIVPPEPKTTVTWAEREREQAVDATKNWYAQNLVEMGDQLLGEWERLPRERRPADIWVRWGAERGNYRVPGKMSLREWNENPSAVTYLGPLRMIADHGDAAIPGLFARDAFKPSWNDEELFRAQLHAIGKESALVAARALARRKAWRKTAHDWIASHAAIVAQSLLPVALGPDGRERNEAENALRVAARVNRAAVEDAAKTLGGDAARAAMELVDRDPLVDLDVKGKLPPFLRVEDLPPLVTRAGKRLPDEAVLALLEILRSTTPDAPYAGLDEIRAALEEASLGDFTWAVVQAWILAGAKGTFEWIPHSLALVGDDSCARRLAPYVREWARKDAKKAKMAVDVLAEMGSSAALLHLSYVADKSRFDEAKKHAKEALERAAAQQGLTTDELADRTVPDLELDAGGTATLDFGPRKFTVTFDEGLRPVVKAEDGARLPTFPRGTKTDDAALVKAASARFKAIKADAETVAQSLLRRFEAAMVRGRTWRADSFRAYVMGHPLVTHLVRRLVWSAGGAAFRVAEDGTLADEKDAEYTLSDDATIALPHPLVLGSAAVTAWSRIFADYAIVQPFEQLARAVHVPTPAEREAQKLERFEGRKSKPGPLMGSLAARGWVTWPDETSLSQCGKVVRKKDGTEAHVALSFSPGIDLGNVAGSEEQVLRAPALMGVRSFDEIAPIDFSELVRDLEAIAH